MDILIDYLHDPIISAVILIVITLMALVMQRTRSVALETSQKRKETGLILISALALYLLLGAFGMVTLSQSVFFPPGGSSAHAKSPTNQTATPLRVSTPAVVPTPTPTSTPLPVLNRSITQELTTFCDAIAHKDYQTAWGQFTQAFQQQHAQADAIAVWNHFTGCSVLESDPNAGPSTWGGLTITMEQGYVDQYGFSDQAPYRFTMQVENATWRIAQVCHYISAEACAQVSWA